MGECQMRKLLALVLMLIITLSAVDIYPFHRKGYL